eukprot:8601897-Prorocentrum_lima.AAC.1
MALYTLTGDDAFDDEEYDLLEGLTAAARELDQDQVREGRREEMRRLKYFDVYAEIPANSFDGEVVDTRWVDVQKCGFVRSRIVGKQFANER